MNCNMILCFHIQVVVLAEVEGVVVSAEVVVVVSAEVVAGVVVLVEVVVASGEDKVHRKRHSKIHLLQGYIYYIVLLYVCLVLFFTHPHITTCPW